MNVKVPLDFLRHRKAIVLAQFNVPQVLSLLGVRSEDTGFTAFASNVKDELKRHNIAVCNDMLVLLEPVTNDVPLIIYDPVQASIFVYKEDYHNWPELPDITNTLIGD